MNADAAKLKALMLSAPRRTLAVAESLTTGNLQARIAAVPGASDYFLGGVTAYGLNQKVKLLGVRRTAARRVNCVSAAVAEQMALGAAKLFGADVAAATTGYAQPNAAWKVTRPFAWIAVAWRDGKKWAVRSARVESASRSRVYVQRRIARAALAMLVARLREPRG